MKIVFGARTRCGGQFLINMTSALLGNLPEPLSSITSGRFETMLNDKKDQFRELYLHGYGWKYFEKYSITSVKLEDPAIDFMG